MSEFVVGARIDGSAAGLPKRRWKPKALDSVAVAGART